MFDATKFDGDKVTRHDFALILGCKRIHGVYQVKLQYSDTGEEEYVITSDEPMGKIIVLDNENGETVAIYCGNDVETNCLIDLL